jgi:hypothetical protein
MCSGELAELPSHIDLVGAAHDGAILNLLAESLLCAEFCLCYLFHCLKMTLMRVVLCVLGLLLDFDVQ